MGSKTKVLAALLLAMAACGGGASAGTGGGGGASTGSSTGAASMGVQPPARDLYRPAIEKIVIEIDYAPGAEPYTGAVLGFGELWDVFRTNAERLFEGGGKVFEIPTQLDQMEKLSDVSGADFTPEQILDIAAKHRNRLSMGDTATFYVVWLDGYYRENGVVRDTVLGVSLGETGVIAMFKPVIAATSSGTPGIETERYVEQATLVHEFGHAAGLVNNGLGPAGAHEDGAHPRHCSNQDCVMYWAVEGPSGAIDYVQKALLAKDTILWGSECLADAEKAIGSP